MPILIILLLLALAFYFVGVFATLKFLGVILGAILLFALPVLGFFVLRDVYRVLRFRLSLRAGPGFTGDLLTPKALSDEISNIRHSFRKHTKEEERELRSYAYASSASIDKLRAFLWILHRGRSFVLSDWAWRVWWRGCIQAWSINKSNEIRDLAVSQSDQNLERIIARDLELLLTLYPEAERERAAFSWANCSYQRARRAKLQELAEAQTETGASAIYSLMVYYVSRRDRAQAFHYFQRYQRHPRATKQTQAELTLKPLFTPTIGELNSALGLSWIYLENTERATWRLCPLEVERPAESWMDQPAIILPQARVAAPIERGSYRMYKLPFSTDKVGVMRAPKRRGATVIVSEAEPIEFPRWSECFDTPRARTDKRGSRAEQPHRRDLEPHRVKRARLGRRQREARPPREARGHLLSSRQRAQHHGAQSTHRRARRRCAARHLLLAARGEDPSTGWPHPGVPLFDTCNRCVHGGSVED